MGAVAAVVFVLVVAGAGPPVAVTVRLAAAAAEVLAVVDLAAEAMQAVADSAGLVLDLAVMLVPFDCLDYLVH